MPQETTIRLRRNERAEKPPGIVINERDIETLAAVEKYRYLTTGQIKKLCFDACSVQVCRLRLLKLYQNGYLNRIKQEIGQVNGSTETVYCLDRKGVETLAVHFDEEPDALRYQPHYTRVKPMFLRHTLAIIQFRLDLEEEISRKPDESIFRWFNEYDVANPTAKKKRDKFYIYDEVIDTANKNKRLTVYPDAAFVLERKGEGRRLYFVEIDMGTMTHKRIREKMRAYEIYKQSKKYCYRYGKEYDTFQVIFQTNSQARIDNLRESLKGEMETGIFFIYCTSEKRIL